MDYYYFYNWQNADLRLDACAGHFPSIEEEMPPQIKFPTSNNLLKDPLGLSGNSLWPSLLILLTLIRNIIGSF